MLGYVLAGTVYVETKNLAGGLTGGIPFQLSVLCPNAANTSIGVVAANSYTSRSSAATSSFTTGTGNYTVVTNRTIRNVCATIATRGQIDRSVPFDPATVEVTGGPAPNTVGVQTRVPLASGGSLKNEAFHAAVVC